MCRYCLVHFFNIKKNAGIFRKSWQEKNMRRLMLPNRTCLEREKKSYFCATTNDELENKVLNFGPHSLFEIKLLRKEDLPDQNI